MEKIKKVINSNLFYIILGIVVLSRVGLYFSIMRTSAFNGNETSFQGVVESIKITDTKMQMRISTNPEDIVCNYYFKDDKRTDYGDYELGSTVKVEGSISEPLNNTVPNTFNYKKYLYYKDIFYTCTIDSLEIVSGANLAYKVKNAIIDRIMNFDIKDYLYTLIVGDKALLDDDVYSKYRENGISHLFAISGMHIGLFSVMLLKILSKLKVNEKVRYTLVTGFIWFYAFLVGFTASVMRAAMLFSFSSINKLLKLEVPPFKVFLLVGLVAILNNPGNLVDIGFIYSFTIAGGLILSKKFLSRHKVVGTSLVATLYSIPITASSFYKINLFGLVNNLLFVPLISSVVYPLCLLTFIFRFLEPVAKISLLFTEYLNDIAYNLDFLCFVVPKTPIAIIVVYYFLLVKKFNKKPFLITSLTFLLILGTKLIPLLNMFYTVDFLDVGQGDSTLIVSPHSKEIMLIDTGGVVSNISNYNPSDNTIMYLHSLGLDRIDWLILSHGDADHVGDAIHVMEKVKVKNVMLNLGEINEAEKKIIDFGANIRKGYDGKMKVEFLNDKVWGEENSDSIVMLFDIFENKFLLMGDADIEVENYLLTKEKKLDADIIKLGHHGSKTSSGIKFLDTITPDVAIISSGRRNRYNHPSREVIDNLEKLGIPYLNTQQDGTISFKIDRKSITYSVTPP